MDIETAAASKMIEPVACARKYLTLASVVWFARSATMIGTKHSRLISRKSHKTNQFLAETAAREATNIIGINKAG